jgi:hypothetical protein
MRCMGAAAVCEKNVNTWAELDLDLVEALDFSRGNTQRQQVRLKEQKERRFSAGTRAKRARICEACP